ncbi:MAG: 2-isopropylmalate synthase [Candidatus Peribacteraceae bacterium]|nr:2-isopropylmalate synthase [Candidatus Peribacteraceae bacterium]
MKISAPERRIQIFDTTLRDGEQSPGCSMTLDQKMEVAIALQRLGADVIEAGFPIASEDDHASVTAIAKEVRKATICGLARCNHGDIDCAWDAVQYARDPRIHVFLATSAIHRESKLKMTKEQIIRRAVEGVERAKGYCPNVEFSPEDAVRTEIDFLCKVVRAAIAAGATTVNIPDTVGYAVPDQMGRLIRTLRRRVPNIDQATISVHCHDDLGMAVANSLAAVDAGAGQIECTINGIGERAGNCSLEEVVMAMRTRRDIFHAVTGIRTRKLVETSDLVESFTFPKARNKAVVGKNAFAHEAGIHQDGFLKDRRTYEIMRPGDVGRRQSDLVLGKHSGIRALAACLQKDGLPLRDEDRKTFRQRFKARMDEKLKAGKGKYMSDAELFEELYLPLIGEYASTPYVISVKEKRGRKGQPVTVSIRTRDGKTVTGTASGPDEGVIDAFVQGMQAAMPGLTIPAGGFNLANISEGSGGNARVTATMHNDCTVHRTVEAANTNEAILQAHIAAFNTLYAIEEYKRGRRRTS